MVCVFDIIPQTHVCREKTLRVIILKKNHLIKYFIDSYLVSQGRIKYSEVTAFLQKQQDMAAMYLSITTLSNKTITLSESHLIYTRKNSRDKFNTRHVFSTLKYIMFENILRLNNLWDNDISFSIFVS